MFYNSSGKIDNGYYLTLHRIRTKTPISMSGNRNVVLLQHGLLDSAHTWINNLANESLGFILADAGFDVWLGNSRGSTYSQKHAYPHTSNDKFWTFSWDEMAMYDLPASIEFIINETKVDKIFYVGHFQGAKIAFAQVNSDSRLRGRVSTLAALAPVAGYDTRNMDSYIYLTQLPIYIAHAPVGTSVQNMVHYCQAMWQGCFQTFDFGAAENMVKYNRTTPPPYGLDAVGLPVTVYWSGQDWLAPPRDISRILTELSRGRDAQMRDVYLPDYNHLDFVWGVDAASYIYRDIIHFFRQHQ
ncbi:Lipase member M [Echinococcus granulosus]|uniref:Lipase member M n=1 Tax=Echinococcus granulosus TaxID=6210 RepID=W6UVM3_ECHGR|nr:Lipase member M [Echinococcus granulosus]EUB57474.1 Lipase member M [Echinococcus granulosus]